MHSTYSAKSRVGRTSTFALVHPANSVVVSGGAIQAGCPTEALVMELMLRANGVRNPILRDDYAVSTAGNAANVATMNLGKTMVLVTSQIHLPRAKGEFAQVGITAVGAPANMR